MAAVVTVLFIMSIRAVLLAITPPRQRHALPFAAVEVILGTFDVVRAVEFVATVGAVVRFVASPYERDAAAIGARELVVVARRAILFVRAVNESNSLQQLANVVS